jgi:DNA-binding transcriptional LysR family regulator
MDIPRLDAWALHCFTVLVRERNVTRAGLALGLSQPAASAVLARLRELFQDPILVKSASAMIPTPRAIEMAARAERILDDMRGLVGAAEPGFEPALFSGSVSIAASDFLRVLLLPALVALLEREAPQMRLDIHHADRTRIHERLERAEVDLGFGPRFIPTGRLHYRELWQDRGVCVARAGSGPAFARLDAAQFAALPHIQLVPAQPSYYDSLLDKALLGLGLRRRIVISENGYLMVPALVRTAGLVATVPRRFADAVCADGMLDMFEPPVDLGPTSMGLFWHERTHREPVFRWLRGRIAHVAGLEPEGQPVPA